MCECGAKVGAGSAPGKAAGKGPGTAGRPEWADAASVTRTHDARAAIAAGEHPKQRVISDLAGLADGDVYALVTPFVPAPLVEVARAMGFAAWSAEEGDAVVRTFFKREPTAGR